MNVSALTNLNLYVFIYDGKGTYKGHVTDK
jgi:hypothetical protein